MTVMTILINFETNSKMDTEIIKYLLQTDIKQNTSEQLSQARDM